jgi:hypothetical protein
MAQVLEPIGKMKLPVYFKAVPELRGELVLSTPLDDRSVCLVRAYAIECSSEPRGMYPNTQCLVDTALFMHDLSRVYDSSPAESIFCAYYLALGGHWESAKKHTTEYNCMLHLLTSIERQVPEFRDEAKHLIREGLHSMVLQNLFFAPIALATRVLQEGESSFYDLLFRSSLPVVPPASGQHSVFGSMSGFAVRVKDGLELGFPETNAQDLSMRSSFCLLHSRVLACLNEVGSLETMAEAGGRMANLIKSSLKMSSRTVLSWYRHIDGHMYMECLRNLVNSEEPHVKALLRHHTWRNVVFDMFCEKLSSCDNITKGVFVNILHEHTPFGVTLDHSWRHYWTKLNVSRLYWNLYAPCKAKFPSFDVRAGVEAAVERLCYGRRQPIPIVKIGVKQLYYLTQGWARSYPNLDYKQFVVDNVCPIELGGFKYLSNSHCRIKILVFILESGLMSENFDYVEALRMMLTKYSAILSAKARSAFDELVHCVYRLVTCQIAPVGSGRKRSRVY